MRLAPAFLLLGLVLAGCVAQPESDSADRCDDVDVDRLNDRKVVNRFPPPLEPYDGTGVFVLQPSEPLLTPGENLTFRLSFTNPDCHTFVYTTLLGDCGNSVLRIGAPPLLLYGFTGGVSLAPLVQHSCGVSVTGKAIGLGRGETYHLNATWDGSFRFHDLAAYERGEGWVERTYWASPGDWELSYGFDATTPYDVEARTVLRVVENDLNRGSLLHPTRCTGGREPGAGFNVTFGASSMASRIGSPVTYYANYSLAGDPGDCHVFGGGFRFYMHGDGWMHYFEPPCVAPFALEPNQIFVDVRAGAGQGSLRFTWDGNGAGSSFCDAPARPGAARLGWMTGSSTITSPFEIVWT